MRTSLFFSFGAVLIAMSIWGLFGFIVTELYRERAEYRDAGELIAQEAKRGESAARLRASVQGTEAERAALKNLVALDVVRAVQVLEATAKQAGARNASVGGITPISSQLKPGEPGVTSVVLTAEGSFVSLMRLVALYETLAIPSTLEQFEMEYIENGWRATIRIRLLVAATS